MPRARTRDVTRSRVALLAVLAMGIMLVPVASALDGSAATAQPSFLRPGAPMELSFTVQDPALLGLAGVSIGSRVSCTLTAPDGITTSGCVAVGPIVEVDVSPSTRSYVWQIAAPAAEGAYRVHFERTSTLALPSDAASADATFTVSRNAPASAPTNGTTNGEPLNGAQTSGTPSATSSSTSHSTFAVFFARFGIAPPPPADAASAHRMLVANVAGSSTLLVLFFAMRHGGSP